MSEKYTKYKKRVAIQLTEEMILHVLGVDSSKFSLSRVYHKDYGVVKFIIDGDGLPEIAEGQEPPIRDIEYFKKLEDK